MSATPAQWLPRVEAPPETETPVDDKGDIEESDRAALLETEQTQDGFGDGTETRYHVVESGKRLALLARRCFQGSTLHWIRIWRANQEMVADPDSLRPGLQLRIPPGG